MNHLKKRHGLTAHLEFWFFVTCLEKDVLKKHPLEEAKMILTTSEQSLTWLLRIARCALLCISLTLFICSCARIMAPEGGPKDTTPPKLIQVSPTQGSTGFKGKIIKLVFDKEIEVYDIYNKLVITPKLQKLKNKLGYEYSVRGNTLKIKLKVPLEEETTYTFNFNDAIKDITEGNTAKNPMLAFSTGEQIDAMYVAGQVKYLMTNQPASNVLVALCSKVDDERFNILDNPPDYFVKADEKGKFKLDYVRKGKYYAYASTNKNNQPTIELSADEYGFLKDPIDLTEESVEGITLSILKADIRKFELKSQKPQDQYFELGFNKPVADYKLSLAHKPKRSKKSQQLYSHLVENKQVIRVYNTLGLLAEDSVKAHLTAQDELGAAIEETIDIHFREGISQKHTASYKFEPPSGAAINPDFIGTMTCNKPVKEVVIDRLFFLFNEDDKVRINTDDLQWNTQRDVMTIKKQLDPRMLEPQKPKGNKNEETVGLVLHIEEEAFMTVEGDRNEAMRHRYTFINPKEYGTVRGTIATEAPGFIVQLLDTEYKVVDAIRNERNYQFKEVLPGNYRLRVLVLKTKDAEWYAGNIQELKEPDPVIFYPAEVGVIANWEVEGIDFVF